jgi:hypothetical protein
MQTSARGTLICERSSASAAKKPSTDVIELVRVTSDPIDQANHSRAGAFM